MSTPTTQRRTLKEHDSLFISSMLRQAGTLAKAGLEGIMNSVDSYFRMRKEGHDPDNPVIEMTLTASHLTIVDTGLGLASEEEILEVWETFGTPHEEDELGRASDTTFGKFRMGRGQLFAFGPNTWRTRTFEMKTDLKKWAREYDLTSGLPDHPGCSVEVELYDTLTLRGVQDTVDSIAKMAQYIGIDLVINGEKRNTDPATMKWDVETDDVYINKKNATSRGRGHWGHGLEIYQQGVFVQQMSAGRFGIEGTVVSKGELQLNWARNEVMENVCDTWKRIRKFLKAEGIADVQRKKRLNKHEARNFVEEFSGGDGEVTYEMFFTTACLPDVTGKLWSGQQLDRLIRSNAKTPKIMRDPDGCILVGFAEKGDKIAEKVMKTRRGVVLDKCVLQRLRVDHLDGEEAGQAALKTIRGEDSGCMLRGSWVESHDRFNGRLKWTDYKALLGDDDDVEYHRFSPDEHNGRELDFLRCIQQVLWRIDSAMNGWQDRKGLKLCMGASDMADAWTDGETMITFDRGYVTKLIFGNERDWHKAGLVVANLFCYKQPSNEDNDVEESVEYLQDYLTASKLVPDSARAAFQQYRKIVGQRMTKMPKAIREQLNIEAETYASEQLAYQVPEAPTGETAVGLNPN